MRADEMLGAVVIACIVRYRLDRKPTWVIVDRAALPDARWSIVETCAHALMRSVTRPVRHAGHLRAYHVLAIDRVGNVPTSDVPADRRYVVDGTASSFVVACLCVADRALMHAMTWG